MKSCTKCGQTKEDTEFYLEKAKRKDGSIREFRRSHCRACETKRKKARDSRTKDDRANQHLLNKYGLTLKDRDKLAEIQGGCGICGTKKPGGRHNTWNIDHCHNTGMVRGVLCWNCNVAIGKLNDDSNLLRRATQWVEQSEQPELSLLRPSPMESCDCYVHGPLPGQDLHGSKHQPT